MSGRWLAGKVFAALLTFAFVLVFNFFLFRVMGDPTTQLARLPQATPQELRQLRHDYGLDKPLLGQFTDYVGDTLRGDLGISQRSREPVWDEIKRALPWTLLLVGTGTVLATLIGAWLGVVAATRRGKRADNGLLGFSLFTYAAPEYWIGIILILVFAVWIPIFPAGLQVTPGVEFSGFFSNALDVAKHLVLPATAMTLLPLGTLSAIQFGAVVGGAITIETIFSWPGLGELSFQAINDKDFPVLEGTFLIFSAGVILANLLADCLYFYLDPRVQSR
jgi:peptide/nickel transport system permease protein